MAKPPTPPPIQALHLKETGLTFAQESLWFLQQFDPDNFAYNLNVQYKFTGGIEHHFLEQAINELVRRHEPLRTIYPSQGGRPMQVVQPFQSISMPFMDLSSLPQEEQEQAVQRVASELYDQPFNLEQGPLLRPALLHTAASVDYFIFSIHHICFDAWSHQVFFSELMQLYDTYRSGKEPVLPELSIQYNDYATWQREWLSGETLNAFIEHWKNILSGDLPVLELPTDRPRPALQTFRGARFTFPISEVLSNLMKDFCQRERMTLFQLLMAGYALLLMRHTGQEDIIIGCPFANRPRQELDGLVGFFVNTLPIRVNLQGNPSVREYLGRVRTVMLDAYPWQAAPFETLVSEIAPQRDLSRTPVFQAVINMRNVPKRLALLEGLEIEKIPREDAPRPFEITLIFEVGVDGKLDASFHYNVDLYDESTISNLATHYLNLLSELLTKPACPIADLEMLTASELKRILVDGNSTEVEFPQICIQDLVSGQAEKDPEALAIICNGSSITYGDLEKQANQLAHYLRANGVEAEDRIGLYLPRSEILIVAQLAILKAGGAYVHLDPIHPVERIAYMVKDTDPAAVITLLQLSNQLPGQVKKICLDTESDSIDACDQGKPVSITNPESLAYVIYTSGSTGRPKGVLTTQRGVLNYLHYIVKTFQLKADEKVIQLTSLSFDPACRDTLGVLTFGATVILMDDEQMRDPDFIYATILEQRVTCILSVVPTMLRAVALSASEHGVDENHLRLIMPSGEALQVVDVDLVRNTFGKSLQIVNQYGPSECSMASTMYPVPAIFPDDILSVPIGKPISNVRIYLLDKNHHLVPFGVKGEIYIGGVAVGRGYLNQPEFTNERFLPDPFQPNSRMYRTGDLAKYSKDGILSYLGRLDHQVKIRGYRVELGEIESVALECPGIKDAAVVLWADQSLEVLAAYITLSKGEQGAIKEILQHYLSTFLPFYMQPSTIMVLDEMPLTSNRKIDRTALPRPERSVVTDRYLAPRNDIETRLVSIWKEVLEVEQVGVRNNFFELGGHSLMAVRLLVRIQQEFKQTLPLMILFQNGTVEALAQTLGSEEKPTYPQGIIPIQPDGPKIPLFVVSGGLDMREMLLSMVPGRPVYGLESVENGNVVYRQSVQETAKIYYQNLLEFFPDGPFLLLGHSASGYYALELARLLINNGKSVGFLGLLDTYPPGPRRNANIMDRVRLHYINIQGKDLAGILQYILQILRIILKRWGFRIGSDVKKITREDGNHKEIRRLLSNTYKPDPYPGKVTLFSASERPWYVRWDLMEPWAKTLIGQLDILPVQGDHISILKQPQAAELAKKIESLLPHN